MGQLSLRSGNEPYQYSGKWSRKKIKSRFDVIRSLDTGWDRSYTGKERGEPFDLDWLDEVEAFVCRLVFLSGEEVPHIVPDGNDVIELDWERRWTHFQYALTVIFFRDRVDNDGFDAGYYTIDMDDPDNEEDHVFNLTDGPEQTAAFIKKFLNNHK